ncbi:hypothetical protein SAMN02745903_00371 [Pseudomonas sp. URMO17WK12:I5]|nr:hypothetical protein H040_00371 [Pseudomonas sp. URMO17WK12:I7]SME92868.1 hypothetical protein SAMN02745903_00371 [Pseudomonas sp. URMO17WK12:I5]
MPHLAVEVGRFLWADADGLTGLEFDAHPATEHDRERLARVADKIVELAAFASDDAGVGGGHASLWEGAGDRVVIVGAGGISRCGRQRSFVADGDLVIGFDPRMPALVTGVVAFVCSLVGFISLVGQVYPLFGYLGSVLMAAVLLAWVRRGRSAKAVVAQC